MPHPALEELVQLELFKINFAVFKQFKSDRCYKWGSIIKKFNDIKEGCVVALISK